jgi:hypothetical protein
MHYLRRKDKQRVWFCVTDAVGYHRHHKPSEVHAMGPASRAILRPRGQRLAADPRSTREVVDTPPGSREALLEILRKSSRPEDPLDQKARSMLSWRLRQFLNRLRKANRKLWKGPI